MKTECLILLIGIKGIDNQSIALAKNLDLKFKTIKIKINLLIKTFPFFGNIFNNLENNFKLIEKYNFPDHHKYRDQDIIKILKNHGENITILTTEKDAVKLCEYRHLLEGISVYYVPISITFLNKVSILEYLPK